MNTFSESWHRIALLRLSLRPQVRVHRQHVRGETWFVLHDPLSNQFFRLRRPAWDLLARCDGLRTLQEIWDICLERDPDGALGQTEVLQLLAQLHAANLIAADIPADTLKIFERHRKRSRREFTGKLLGFMFARFPLFNPDRFLARGLPLVKWLFSKFGFALWLLLIVSGLKVAIDHFPALADQSQGVLAPDNLALLYVSLAGLSLLHEFGHAFACKRFGGAVPTMGVMLLVFTPLPYVDVTSSWSFRSRRHRLIVGAAGMMTELAVASLAAWIWAATGPGLINSLAYNVMFLASVSTLLFNANPLLRFDGYYLLSDGANLPNLYPRAQQQIKYLAERHLLGLTQTAAPAQNVREGRWLATYGITSAVYRVFVCAAIILFVAGQFLLLGALMALFCIIAWGVVPLAKGIHFLVTSPRLDRRRPRAWAGVAIGVGMPLLLLGLVPVPRTFVVPGLVETDPYTVVVAEAPGFVTEILAPTGTDVAAGQPLLRLVNDGLKEELRAADARLAEARLRERSALRDGSVYHATAGRYREAAAQQQNYLQQQTAALTIHARQAGRWVAPRLEDQHDMFLARGTHIGEIVGQTGAHFIAIVPQGSAAGLFDQDSPIRRVKLRLRGRSDETLSLAAPTILPGQRQQLPSAALGWQGGGPIAVREDDASGRATREPFFTLEVPLPADFARTTVHGQTGRLLVMLPPAPVLVQSWDAFRQLLQKRFQL